MTRPKRQRLSEGRAWHRTVTAVVIRDMGKCWICGHWGARSADHVIPDTEGGKSVMDNLKAAHGVGSPCPDCSIAAGKPVFCNEIKSMGSVERARRVITEKTGLRLPVGDETRPGPEGRLWLRSWYRSTRASAARGDKGEGDKEQEREADGYAVTS